ncbi:MAG: HAMP domain-containing histidine kinase [Planctomycetaceae bacterium]|jgi:signal transduction histidine kinase|nr:HAMP domain-containing histidine kinase [Planctomycetaceae bacterium]
MKTTKFQKPPQKGTLKKSNIKITPHKKQTTTSKKQKTNTINQSNVDVGDDSFWLGFLSGERTVAELREYFDLELERQKLDALAEFAAGAGHEINNPLAIISGYAQLLIRETENIEHRHKLALIIAQVKRAYEMIADIRYFARPPIPVTSRFDLVTELRKVVAEQKSKMHEIDQEIDLEINFKTEVKSLCVETDQVQLHIAISAICNNARESLLSKRVERRSGEKCGREMANRASRKVGDYILICLREVGNVIEISVEDNGTGISPEMRQLIFCPYFSGRQAGRGLGFGLPKTWRIIQLLGGSIKTETGQKNKGAKFIITIPQKIKK